MEDRMHRGIGFPTEKELKRDDFNEANKVYEKCVICDAYTGKEANEDPLYSTLAIKLPNFPLWKKGMKVGPLCCPCYDCLSIIGATE